MSEGGSHTRRQLTLFATGEIAERIDAVRRVVDPVQHALIPAHVTLCREGELASLSAAEIEKRVRRLARGPLALRFGRAERFDEHGILLRCIDGQADYQRLRVALLGDPAIRENAAHLTLAHPAQSVRGQFAFRPRTSCPRSSRSGSTHPLADRTTRRRTVGAMRAVSIRA
ncbi:MAG: 2'-5' RNA ligase family protein [Candidatus Eisenbacteria bacterium]